MNAATIDRERGCQLISVGLAYRFNRAVVTIEGEYWEPGVMAVKLIDDSYAVGYGVPRAFAKRFDFACSATEFYEQVKQEQNRFCISENDAVDMLAEQLMQGYYRRKIAEEKAHD